MVAAWKQAFGVMTCHPSACKLDACPPYESFDTCSAVQLSAEWLDKWMLAMVDSQMKGNSLFLIFLYDWMPQAVPSMKTVAKTAANIHRNLLRIVLSGPGSWHIEVELAPFRNWPRAARMCGGWCWGFVTHDEVDERHSQLICHRKFTCLCTHVICPSFFILRYSAFVWSIGLFVLLHVGQATWILSNWKCLWHRWDHCHGTKLLLNKIFFVLAVLPTAELHRFKHKKKNVQLLYGKTQNHRSLFDVDLRSFKCLAVP